MTSPTKPIQPDQPRGIRALSLFFFIVSLISCSLGISLIANSQVLNRIWRLNPTAHELFVELGTRGVVFLLSAAILSATAAAGLWRLRRWGHRLTIGLIALNLVGDLFTLFTLRQPHAITAILIAVAALAYLLSRSVRSWFDDDFPVHSSEEDLRAP